MDTEKQRQRRRDDARLTKSGTPEANSYLWCLAPTDRVSSQQRMAAGRALEWIGVSKPGWFLDKKYHTCFQEYLLFIILLETRSWNDSPPMGTAVFTLKFMP